MMDRRQYLGLTVMGGLAMTAGCTGDTDDEPTAVDDGDDDSPAVDDDESEPATEDEQGDDETADEVDVRVGDHVEGDSLSLVVEGVERGVDLGDFFDADPGNEFVVVELALKNTTDEFVSVSNLLQTRLRDAEDYQYDQTFAGGDGNTFNDGEFAPGEVERGGLVFEIPEDAGGLALVFDFDVSVFGGIDRATIDLEREADSIHELVQNLQIDVSDVGDAVEFGNVEVVVNDTAVENEIGFAEPDDGEEFVIVDISITNETGEEQSFSTVLQMMMKDGDGYTYQEDFGAAAGLDRGFDEGTPLSDGETRRGELVYEVPETLSPLYWVFEFDLFANGDKTFWQVR